MQPIRTFLLSLAFIAQSALAADSPYTRPDDTWISLSGTVEETAAETFVLDYGKGEILVEMDDWDWYENDARGLMNGDKVTVYGMVDDDFAEATTIEASSVYVEDIGSVFYANAADEEDYRYTVITPVVTGFVEVIGTVATVGDDEFTVDTGPREITVDTSTMAYDPLDDEGYQQVDQGDLVNVTGNMEDDLLSDMELVADTIVTLQEDNS